MIRELTQEQRAFAAEHHNLIYAFLNARRLPDDEYYDVAVFGYLKAVARYLANAELRERYKFSTIAYVKMSDAVYDERVRCGRLKRRGFTVSLDEVIGIDGELLTRGDSLSAPDSMMAEFETEQLFRELSEWLSPREMDVIRLRVDGYRLWEISRELQMPPVEVHTTMRGLRDTVYAVCA